MALQVWLPLNGSLENQGLSDVTITNNGATVDNNGKIGKCYSFSYETLSSILNLPITGPWSACCWVYPTSFGSHNYIVSIGGTTSTTFLFSLCLYSSGYPAVRFANITYYSLTALILKTWSHIGFTFDGSQIKIYLNGSLIYTKNSPVTPKAATNLYIGARGGSAGYFHGKLNDVRIYDHVLSPKEVKELSKGLVLHYKLDKPNLLLYEYLESTGTQYIDTGVKGDLNTKAILDLRIPTSDSTDHSGSYFGCRDGQNSKAFLIGSGNGKNTTNTYFFTQFDTVYSTIITNPILDFSRHTIELSKTGYYFDGTQCRTYSNVKSFQTTYTLPLFAFYSIDTNGSDIVPGKLIVYSLKLYENGVLVRNMLPCTFLGEPGMWDTVELKFYGNAGTGSFTVGPEIGYFDSVIRDCSGYKNNGTLVSTANGDITIIANSPRYNNCLYMNNIGTSNHIEADQIGVSDNIFTVSFWIKADKSINQVFFADPKISIGILNNLLTVAPKTSPLFTINNFITNEWNHIVAIRNNSTYYVYINGVAETTTSTNNYYIHNGNKLYLLNKNYDNNYAANASISDVRVYATALSSEDVLKLYLVEGSIDNQGSISCYEFLEETLGKQQILNTGIIKIDNFIENNDKFKVLQDGSVFILLLHHNNPASNLFTVNNCWLNNDSNLFSIMTILKDSLWVQNLEEFEFLVYEKLTSSSTEEQYRWKLTSNPALSTSVTGFQVISGSPAHLSPGLSDSTHGCIDINGSTWWCCCGCYTMYLNGIPGFNGVVTSGYLDLYIKIPDLILKGNIADFVKFYTKSILTNQLIEI